ncbi:hypothetical protein Tco_1007477 [Tanacetum coccineum]
MGAEQKRLKERRPNTSKKTSKGVDEVLKEIQILSIFNAMATKSNPGQHDVEDNEYWPRLQSSLRQTYELETQIFVGPFTLDQQLPFPSCPRREIINEDRNACNARGSIRQHIPKLSDDELRDIECDVTNDEIKRAVWDCETDKAPGPDGFTFGFYRRFWDLIQDDVYAAVRMPT